MKKLFLLIVGLFVIMAMLTACGQQAATQTAAKTTTTQNTAATGDVKADLSKFLASKANVASKVEYSLNVDIEMQTQTGGSIKQNMVATETISQKNGNMKISTVQNTAGQLSMVDVYNVNGQTYTCVKMGDNFNCIKGDQTQGTGQKSPSDIEDSVSKYQVKTAPDKTVAGEATKCYKIYAGEVAIDDVIMTECFTSDGIAAYTSIAMQGHKYTLEAKSIARTVDDADFKVPISG